MRSKGNKVSYFKYDLETFEIETPTLLDYLSYCWYVTELAIGLQP